MVRRSATLVGAGLLAVLAAAVGLAAMITDSDPSAALTRPQVPGSARMLVPFGAERSDGVTTMWAFGRTSAAGRLVVLRRRGDDEWGVAPEPVDGSGTSLAALRPVGTPPATSRGPGAPQHAGEMATDGHAALLAYNPDDAAEVRLLERQPAGRFTAVDAPTLDPDERLVPDADDEAARALLAVVGGDEDEAATFVVPTTDGGLARGVLRHDAGGWTRELIDVPSGSELYPVGIGATSRDQAWMLARAGADADAAPTLLRRTTTAGASSWIPVPLAGDQLLDPAARPAGVSAVRVTGAPADPLTVTSDGLWIDLQLTLGGDDRDATVHVKTDDAPEVDGRWCADDALCNHPFPLAFATTASSVAKQLGRGEHGYRSVAFPAREGDREGAPFGGRLISAAVDADTTPEDRALGAARQGGYAELSGSEFEFRDGIGESGGTTTQALAADGEGTGATGGDYAFGAFGLSGERPPRVDAPTPQFDTPIDLAHSPNGDGRILALTRGNDLQLYTPGRGWSSLMRVAPPYGPAAQSGTARAIVWPWSDIVRVVFNGGAVLTLNREPQESDPFASTTTTTTTTTPASSEPTGPPSTTAGTSVDVDGGYVRYLGDRVVPLDIACETNQVEELECLIVGANGYMQLDVSSETTIERLPAPARSDDITSVVYEPDGPAVATEHGLYRRGLDGTWRRDTDLVAAMAEAGQGPGIRLLAVTDDRSGLVVDGRWHQQSQGPWTPSSAPLVLNPVAVDAFRDSTGALRSLVVASPSPVPIPELVEPPSGPQVADFGVTDPVPDDGVLLREGADGWIDLDRASAQSSGGADVPRGTPGYRAILVDDSGTGWVAGGARNTVAEDGAPTIYPRAATRWLDKGGPGEFPDPSGVQHRTGAGDDPAAPAKVSPQAPGTVRIAIGGHPSCLSRCDAVGGQGITPDLGLAGAVTRANALRADGVGPAALIIGGGRSAVGGEPLTPAGARRYRDMVNLAQMPSVIIPGPGDRVGAAQDRVGMPLGTALAVQPAPVGSAPAVPGVTPAEDPEPPPSPVGGPRTMFAFDVEQNGGRVRVIVVDNAGGELVGGVRGPQGRWIAQTLEATSAAGQPAIVIGTAPLDRFGGSRPADDADEEAALFAQGAAAYVAVGGEDDPRSGSFGGGLQSSVAKVPASEPGGTERTLNLYQSATLGYGPGVPALIKAYDGLESEEAIDDSIAVRVTSPGLLVLDVSGGAAKPTITASAEPIAARLDLVTPPSVAKGFAWPISGSVAPMAHGEFFAARAFDDPGVRAVSNTLVGVLPLSQCFGFAGCGTGLDTNATFTSSDPTVGVFVKVRYDGNGVPTIPAVNGNAILDPRSPILCPLKEGVTTITVAASGLSTQRQIRVVPPQPGSSVSGPVMDAAAAQITGGRGGGKKISEACKFDFGSPPQPEPAPEPERTPAPPAPQPPAPEPVPPVGPTIVPALPLVPIVVPTKTPSLAAVTPLSTLLQSAQAPPVRPPIAVVGKPAAPPPPVPPGGGAIQQAPIPATSQAPVQSSAVQSAVQLKDERSIALQQNDNAAVRYAHPEPSLPWEGLAGAALMLMMAGGWTVGRGRRAAAAVVSEVRD